MTMSGERAQPRRSRWIPYAFIGFFGVVVLANAVLLVVAFGTWTGVAVPDAYERGLAYNRELERAAAQEALGWSGALETRQAGERTRVALTLKGPAGAPLERAAVRARFYRPTHEGHDLTVPLSAEGGGLYAAELALPLDGAWEVRVRAEREGDIWRLNERIHVWP